MQKDADFVTSLARGLSILTCFQASDVELGNGEIALRAWSPALRQVSVAHGAAIGDGTRLDPANPIFLVAATKPEAHQ